MMGEANPQRAFFYNISLATFVPDDHPLRRIRPLIDGRAIRHACRDLYAPIGRPSIPPEQLLLALVGGDLLSIPSERRLVMELQCNMAALLVRRVESRPGRLGRLDLQSEPPPAL
jgi:transposase